jgi:hypothetical protein
MLKEMSGAVPAGEVDRSYVDAVVQHVIASGLARGAVPNEKVLAIAEQVGGAEWKDRQLNIAAEAERLFAELPTAIRTQAAIQAALARGADWMFRQPIAASWFEDDQAVRRVIAKVARRDNAGATRLVMNDILSNSRMAWAERFLLMAMWCQAANNKAHREWARDFVVLTHTLVGSAPLQTIPIMTRIAEQTVVAARSTPW